MSRAYVEKRKSSCGVLLILAGFCASYTARPWPFYASIEMPEDHKAYGRVQGGQVCPFINQDFCTAATPSSPQPCQMIPKSADRLSSPVVPLHLRYSNET